MPRRARAEPTTNVREVASSFVGREADLAAITERFERGARLVTVTGPGGIGKTRLATRFAHASITAYGRHGGAGVWMVDLTTAGSAAAVEAAVAGALGVRMQQRVRVGEASPLGAALARKGRVLVVLDNFEHLASSATETVGAWLFEAPQCRFLITSRVRLDLPGEEVWPLTSLPEDDATKLFLHRARQVRADLDEGTGDVAGIVRRLSGVPLAIELAASRVGAMGLAQLRERLEAAPSRVLEGRGKSERHSSMRRTVLDSVAMLGRDAQAFFAASSVFRDGFTLEAAEAVAGPAALDCVEALERASLVRLTSAPGGAEPRFSMFEVVREVATSLLADSDGRGAVSDRHGAYYVGYARRLGREVSRETGGAAFARLASELGNVLAAHEHSIREGAGQSRALALAVGIDPVLAARGLTRLRIRLLGEAIACSGTGDERGLLAEGYLALGAAQVELGAMGEAERALEMALTVATAADLPAIAALAYARIGEILDVSGQTGEAHRRYRRGLYLLSPRDQREHALPSAELHLGIAHAHRREGHLDAAEEAVHAAVDGYRSLGHDEGLAAALYEAAVIAMFQGRGDVALARFDEGLAIARRAGARPVEGSLITARAGLLQERGQLDEALAGHAEAAAIFRELGSRYRETSALYYLATAYLERGELDEALLSLQKARDCVEGVGSPHYEALIDSCRAVALARRGDLAAARAALQRAEQAGVACEREPALRVVVRIRTLTLAAEEKAGDAAWLAATVDEASALVAAHGTDDTRFALRILRASNHRASPDPRDALVVWEGARAFRAPRSSTVVDLTRRAACARILAALARRRRESPGDPISAEDVVRAGWPGEQMLVEAGLNRAYVALNTLRRLGLRGVIRSGGGGYWLEPAVAVVAGEAENKGA